MQPDTNIPILEPLAESTPAFVLRHAKRWITITIGATILGIGIIAILLPGLPAIVIVPIGLAILATELVWARRLLHKIKEKMPFQKKEEKITNGNIK